MFGELGAAIIGCGTRIPVEIVSRFSSESLDLEAQVTGGV
jgi:hypothetical protein